MAALENLQITTVKVANNNRDIRSAKL